MGESDNIHYEILNEIKIGYFVGFFCWNDALRLNLKIKVRLKD